MYYIKRSTFFETLSKFEHLCTVYNEYTHFLVLTYLCLFHIGLLGLVLNRGNMLKIIMSLELLLLSINLNFILFSVYLDDIVGQVFVVFILILSAVESALGLSIISIFYEKRGTIQLNLIKVKNKNFKY